jgi:uncharacterized protein YjbI with pentapeptide repeats
MSISSLTGVTAIAKNFNNATMIGTNFSDANLTGANFSESVYSSETIFPADVVLAQAIEISPKVDLSALAKDRKNLSKANLCLVNTLLVQILAKRTLVKRI